MTISPEAAIALARGLMELQRGVNAAYAAMPSLQLASTIVGNMQAEGRELPTEEERALLRADAEAQEARAQLAIDDARARGE